MINVQEMYEDILAAHWQKLVQLKELKATDSGSMLRSASIKQRQRELEKILNKLEAMELLFDGTITTPQWYFDRIAEHE